MKKALTMLLCVALLLAKLCGHCSDILDCTEDAMKRYMAQADLILSKPGGITLFETICSELPLLAFSPFLQQEINNSRLLDRYRPPVFVHGHIHLTYSHRGLRCAQYGPTRVINAYEKYIFELPDPEPAGAVTP